MSKFLAVLALFLTTAELASAGIPAPALFFDEQLVDHDDPSDTRTWSQRYYIWEYGFEGPGSPIFVIMGGEGNIEPQTGLMYPFVAETLAMDMGAFVLQPEHRFYGESMPVKVTDSYDPREKLFTSKQALQDAVKLIRYYQERLQCSLDHTSPDYCPVITFGGSYPGWLSAMARLLFPDVVDIAYSASAPMKFYAQQTDPHAYYDHIAHVANSASPGCASSVRRSLATVNDIILSSSDSDIEELAVEMGFCEGSIPDYIDNIQTFADELFMIFGYCTANDNMAYYPPTISTRLYQMCEVFDSSRSLTEKVKVFFQHRLPSTEAGCVPMTSQLPTGKNPTISGGDWSGDGTGANGESWDFQTCTLLVEQIGFSNKSMIPPRDWSLEWMNQHCESRFGVKPRPYKLVDEWGFDDMLGKTNASYIIFTNGLNDGWSVSGIKDIETPTIMSKNFWTGAHHSDLNGRVPSDEDTPEIKDWFAFVPQKLQSWLEEIRESTTRIEVA